MTEPSIVDIRKRLALIEKLTPADVQITNDKASAKIFRDGGMERIPDLEEEIVWLDDVDADLADLQYPVVETETEETRALQKEAQRVAQLDLHHGPYFTQEELKELIEHNLSVTGLSLERERKIEARRQELIQALRERVATCRQLLQNALAQAFKPATAKTKEVPKRDNRTKVQHKGDLVTEAEKLKKRNPKLSDIDICEKVVKRFRPEDDNNYTSHKLSRLWSNYKCRGKSP